MGRRPSFVAIDFETANHEPDSACALGLVIVERGKVVREHSWLLDPEEDFDPRFIEIHGIGPDEVAGERTFDELWPELEPLLGGRTVAAHNASFDRWVLLRSCAAYGIEFEPHATLCTVRLTRGLFAFANYKLPTVAAAFGIPLTHHDAASDALACAQIILKTAEQVSWAEILRLGLLGPPTYA